ncbi:MAG TPA: phosphoenolpyruvate--protein phosphotransferase [Chloroflexota bacterium]
MASPLQGIGVSPGVVIGPAHVIRELEHVSRQSGTPEQELAAFDIATEQAAAELESLASRLRAENHEAEAGILDAQALMARDPSLADLVRDQIRKGASAERAIDAAASHYRDTLLSLGDDYLAARAEDVTDVAQHMQRALGTETPQPEIRRLSVVVAHNLTPSQTASFDRELLLGLATQTGGPTSHTAILARTLGIPAVVGLGPAAGEIRSGQEVALDGDTGEIALDLDSDERSRWLERARAYEREKRRLTAFRDLPAETTDGRRITMAANIGSPAEVDAALENGAEGVGLFRTEFLFAERDHMPSEDEQVEAYRSVLEAFRHTVVIRTLDVGADKPLPYIESPDEENPFLGERGIRYSLRHPDLFRVQLRALQRASTAGKLAVMFPMVSEVEQIKTARQMLEDIREEVGGSAQIGIMVEVPAAALAASRLAPLVDFFSVGSNDLTQYTLAVDRVNERIASLYRPLHPSVLRLISVASEAAHAHGKWIGICGEMAGDPLAIPLLIGLGIDELSMAPSRLPVAKERVRGLTFDACREAAQLSLDYATAADVEELLRTTFP